MLTVYPYGSGSLYTTSFATTASFANRVKFISYVTSASNADTVLFPESGSRGKGVCLLTTAQYQLMIATGRVERCEF
jgi:hypothetical protein